MIPPEVIQVYTVTYLQRVCCEKGGEWRIDNGSLLARVSGTLQVWHLGSKEESSRSDREGRREKTKVMGIMIVFLFFPHLGRARITSENSSIQTVRQVYLIMVCF